MTRRHLDEPDRAERNRGGQTGQSDALPPVRASGRDGRSRPGDGCDSCADPGRDPLERLGDRLGNRAVQRLVESGAVRPTLRVGRVDSPAEREADRVADRVLRMPDPLGARGGRDCEPNCGDGGSSTDRAAVRRQSDAARGGQAGEIPTGSSSAGEESVPPELGSRIAALRGGGRPLPDGMRSYFEPRFDADFGDVRVHTGPRADDVTRSLGARAVTVGRDVLFSRGGFRTGSQASRRLVAHELAHVVQNRDGTGRVQSVARRAGEDGGWWDCAKGAAVGAGTGVWELLKAIGGSIWSPIDAIKNAYEGIKELVGTILDLDLAGAAEQAFPKLYKLATRWTTLASFERCKLIGEVISEYGAGLLSGAGAAKIVKRLRSLKRSAGGRRGGSSGSDGSSGSGEAGGSSGTGGGGGATGGTRASTDLESSSRQSTPAPGSRQSTPAPGSRQSTPAPGSRQSTRTPDGDRGPSGDRSTSRRSDRDGSGRDADGDGGGGGRSRGGLFRRATTPWGRRVYQRTDVDWDYKHDGTRTNRELAAAGRAPYTSDGKRIVLHHVNDESGGALAEVATDTHSRRHSAENAMRKRMRRTDPDEHRFRTGIADDVEKRHPDVDPDSDEFKRLVDEEVQREQYKWRQDPEMQDRVSDFNDERAVYWKWRVGEWSRGSTADPSWPGGE